MNNPIEFIINYKNKTFRFKYGSEAYIFHTGIYNDIDRKYGLKGLSEYVTVTHNAYLTDSNRTPLGALADFVAESWRRVKSLDRYTLLDRFYETCGGA